ncbi:MAG TPA: asparagine synthase-related protein, partial [Cytophagaceae bacterium]
GVKPLYYHFKAGRLIFASEIKALMNSAFIKKKINNKAVFDFLSQGLSESEEEGFIIGIKELLAGHNFIFDLNRKEFSTTRYYSLNITEGYQPYDEALNRGYIDQIKDLTAKAVKLRLRSDIPIGATLSGGIDSSSIVSLMDLLAPGDRHKIFTAVFPKDPLDETSWAAKVVKDKRLSWHTWEAKPLDLLDNLESLVYTQDIPINGIATYTHFGLMKFIKTQNIHVILEGQGADELFTGYNSHIPAWLLETLKAGQFRKFIRDFNSFPSTVMDRSTLLRMLSKHTFGNGISSVNLLNILKNHKKDWALIDNNLWKSNVARLGKGRPILQGLNATLEKEFTGQRLKYLLKAGDRNSMAFSIESRLPFSDDINLIEHIFKIPGNYKIRNGYTKVLLREAMKGIIPEDIRLRTDKKGFSTPSSLFINKSVLNECAQYVTGDMDQFFDTKALKGMMSGDPRLHPIHSEKLWRFISLALWMKVYKLN